MKNSAIKSSFIIALSQKVDAETVEHYQSHLDNINICLGQSKYYVYSLSAFHLEFLKLKLEINQTFLSKSKSTQHAYFVALNRLIEFVRSLELQRTTRIVFHLNPSEPYVIARAA